MVPAGAVLAGHSFVVRDGRAHLREVKTGLHDPKTIEILGGVVAGERVVIVGPPSLSDDARVIATDGVVLDRARPSKNATRIK